MSVDLRAEAVEAMAQVRVTHAVVEDDMFGNIDCACGLTFYGGDNDEAMLDAENRYRMHLEAEQLDALLSPPVVPCSECGGTGSVHQEPYEGGDPLYWESCLAGCDHGQVSLPPLAVLMGSLEQVGVCCPRGGGHADLLPEYDDEGEAWRDDGNVHAPCSTKGGFTLFRLRSREEEGT